MLIQLCMTRLNFLCDSKKQTNEHINQSAAAVIIVMSSDLCFFLSD